MRRNAAAAQDVALIAAAAASATASTLVAAAPTRGEDAAAGRVRDPFHRWLSGAPARKGCTSCKDIRINVDKNGFTFAVRLFSRSLLLFAVLRVGFLFFFSN